MLPVLKKIKSNWRTIFSNIIHDKKPSRSVTYPDKYFGTLKPPHYMDLIRHVNVQSYLLIIFQYQPISLRYSWRLSIAQASLGISSKCEDNSNVNMPYYKKNSTNLVYFGDFADSNVESIRWHDIRVVNFTGSTRGGSACSFPGWRSLLFLFHWVRLGYQLLVVRLLKLLPDWLHESIQISADSSLQISRM